MRLKSVCLSVSPRRPNSTFVYYGHLTKQVTWNGPKGFRIRGVPLYTQCACVRVYFHLNLTHAGNVSPVITLHRLLWERLSYISYCIHIVIANMVIFN